MRRSVFRTSIFLLVMGILLGILTCFSYPAIHRTILSRFLYDAVKHSDVNRVRRLLTQGANPNTGEGGKNQNSTIVPVLHIATYVGNRSIVQVLIAGGADINARGERDETALMIASASGRTDIVELLIKQGADVEDKDVIGWTALRYALWQGHIDIVRVLLAHGADVNTKDNSGFTPLKFVECNLHDRALAKRLDFADALVLLKDAGAKE